MKTLIVFLIIFSIIVILHEWGHFVFAKRAGILVREFAIGMGPKLYSHQGADGTTYTLRMLPLGGYVRMAGMDEELEIQPGMEVGLQLNDQDQITEVNLSKQSAVDELPLRVDRISLEDFNLTGYMPGTDQLVTYSFSDHAMMREMDGTLIQIAPLDQTYEAASPWGKLMTNIAGPMNNFILAFVAFLIVAFMVPGVPTNDPILGTIIEDSPAAQVDLKAGDEVIKVDAQPIDSWSQLVEVIHAHPEEAIDLTLIRDGQEITKTVEPNRMVDEATDTVYGQVGITAAVNTSFMSRVSFAFSETWRVATAVIVGLATVIKGLDLEQLGGPIAIAQVTHQVAANGLIPSISFLAFLSANLGVVNLLPIPALDGGKIVSNLIELIRGKPIDREKEGWITVISMALILLLMLVITWNDLMRLFR